MARPRLIDRDHLLDVAEAIVTRDGTTGLSFGSLAGEAGIPKASVQSAFGSREALIDAMLERWLTKERARFERNAGPGASRRDKLRAHIKTTAEEPEDASTRMATLLAALAGTGEQSASAAEWYASRAGKLSARSEEDRRLRIAFLAAEGAFYMRHLVRLDMSEKLWRDIFEDLRQLAAEP